LYQAKKRSDLSPKISGPKQGNEVESNGQQYKYVHERGKARHGPRTRVFSANQSPEKRRLQAQSFGEAEDIVQRVGSGKYSDTRAREGHGSDKVGGKGGVPQFAKGASDGAGIDKEAGGDEAQQDCECDLTRGADFAKFTHGLPNMAVARRYVADRNSAAQEQQDGEWAKPKSIVRHIQSLY
jgi:hypothetical protein